MKIAIKVPDYFQERLPLEQWTYHYEVRQNFGTSDRPHWETVNWCDTEEEANGYL